MARPLVHTGVEVDNINFVAVDFLSPTGAGDKQQQQQ